MSVMSRVTSGVMSGVTSRVTGGDSYSVPPIETFYHWDGDNIETMFTEKTVWPAYDQPRIAGDDGDVIGSWGQRTPSHLRLTYNNNRATQSPTLKLNEKNGRSVVRFNGTSNWLTAQSGGGFFYNSDNLSVYAVAKFRSDSAWGGLMSMGTTNDFLDGMYICEEQVDGGEVTARFITDHGLLTSADLSNEWFLLDFHISQSDDSAELNINGALVDSDTPLTNNFSIDPQRIVVGARWYFSAVQNISDLDLAELIIYEDVLGSGERATVRNWLNEKWAVY